MGHPYFAVARPTVIGHRGCAGEVPENTLASFARGVADGAHILESDVHITRDGVPVLCHDPEVDRTTNGTGAIFDHDLRALQKLDAGHSFARGEAFPFRGEGLTIPTLAEAFAAFPNERFNLEVKSAAPEAAARVLDVVANADAVERTLLTAESADTMERLHGEIDARALSTAIGASTADVLAFIQSAMNVTPPSARSMALQVPADFAGAPLVTEDFVAHAHAHDIVVHVWTINEADEMNRLLDLGVDGLVTDVPGEMVRVLAQRGA